VVGDESRLEESLKECIEEQEGEGEDTANSSEVFKEESLNTILANENLLGRYLYPLLYSVFADNLERYVLLLM
jgi:hypothetical protein